MYKRKRRNNAGEQVQWFLRILSLLLLSNSTLTFSKESGTSNSISKADTTIRSNALLTSRFHTTLSIALNTLSLCLPKPDGMKMKMFPLLGILS